MRDINNVFYVSFLHLCLPGGTQQGCLDPFAGDNHEYKIERIKPHKNTRGRILYQAKWRGYDSTEDSWLREKDLANTSDLV